MELAVQNLRQLAVGSINHRRMRVDDLGEHRVCCVLFHLSVYFVESHGSSPAFPAFPVRTISRARSLRFGRHLRVAFWNDAVLVVLMRTCRDQSVIARIPSTHSAENMSGGGEVGGTGRKVA